MICSPASSGSMKLDEGTTWPPKSCWILLDPPGSSLTPPFRIGSIHCVRPTSNISLTWLGIRSLFAQLRRENSIAQELRLNLRLNLRKQMGVSENSVPLNPMVHDHYPYQMAIIGNIPYFQTNPYSTFCQVGIVLGSPSWVSSDEKMGCFSQLDHAGSTRLVRRWCRNKLKKVPKNLGNTHLERGVGLSVKTWLVHDEKPKPKTTSRCSFRF